MRRYCLLTLALVAVLSQAMPAAVAAPAGPVQSITVAVTKPNDSMVVRVPDQPDFFPKIDMEQVRKELRANLLKRPEYLTEGDAKNLERLPIRLKMLGGGYLKYTHKAANSGRPGALCSSTAGADTLLHLRKRRDGNFAIVSGTVNDSPYDGRSGRAVVSYNKDGQQTGIYKLAPSSDEPGFLIHLSDGSPLFCREAGKRIRPVWTVELLATLNDDEVTVDPEPTEAPEVVDVSLKHIDCHIDNLQKCSLQKIVKFTRKTGMTFTSSTTTGIKFTFSLNVPKVFFTGGFEHESSQTDTTTKTEEGTWEDTLTVSLEPKLPKETSKYTHVAIDLSARVLVRKYKYTAKLQFSQMPDPITIEGHLRVAEDKGYYTYSRLVRK